VRAPRFIIPISVVVAGVDHAGTYDVDGDCLTVHYGDDQLSVNLGGALASRRAEEVLKALVKRRPR
jgi:hypothetical protein